MVFFSCQIKNTGTWHEYRYSTTSERIYMNIMSCAWDMPCALDNKSCYISCSWDNLSWAGNISCTRHINSSVSTRYPMRIHEILCRSHEKKKYFSKKYACIYHCIKGQSPEYWIKIYFEKSSQSKYIYTHRCIENMKRNIAQKCVGCLIQQSISILKFISFISNRNTFCHIKHFNYILYILTSCTKLYIVKKIYHTRLI